MSNAKIASLIAEANRRLVADIEAIMASLKQDQAQLRAEIEQLQSAIAPMATEIERLRAEISAIQGAGEPTP